MPKLPLLMALLLLSTGTVAERPLKEDTLPRTDKPFANRPENFQFVIVGDRTGGHRPGVFGRAIERINQLQPEFVVGVGDLIEGYRDDVESLTAQWDEFDGIVRRLDMPFYYTVGNHDIGNPLSYRLWRERLGRDYYHFVYQDVLFLSLNTEDPPVALSPETLARQAQLEQMMRDDPASVRNMLKAHAAKGGSAPPKLPGSVSISDEQVRWAGKVLTEHPAVRWTIVLMHKPAWLYDSPAFQTIESLLSGRQYTVIAGHEHYYSYTQRQGADYMVMATTGGIQLRLDGTAFDHIAWVTMTDKGPSIVNIALCGLLGSPAQTQAALTENNSSVCLSADE